MAELNGFEEVDLASILFTVTPDLSSSFPARAARMLGWTTVPMLCTREIAVPGGVERCIRVLIHWNTERPATEVQHVYLREARKLRPDWAGGGAEPPGATSGEGVPPAGAIGMPLIVLDPIAFQGEPGAYSEEAIRSWLGAGRTTLPCPSFEAAFQAVRSGLARSAMLPVENSTTGSIHAVYDLLLAYELQVQAEVILPVRHRLMVLPGATANDIHTVLSHPQALEQCAGYLAAHGYQPMPAHDTAGAARLVSERKDQSLAAIASRAAAERYGLQVVADDVQDISSNYTRFWLLAPGEAVGPVPHKTSLIFATHHLSGSLYGCLAELALREVNLTRIESRPDRKTPWNYLFYVDFEGHRGEKRVQDALAGLKRHVTFLRVLGSYARHDLE
jgi:monofunctional chorismate mutase